MQARRRFLALAATAAVPLRAFAQSVPAGKPFRIIVPNAPGGAADITARTLAQQLSKSMGQSVVIENKPGAGGVSAGELAARAEPDGRTLLLISSGTAVSAALFKSLPFNTLADFSPVSMLATFDLVLVTAQQGRFKTLGELLAWARANPGKLNIATPNIGTTQHLAAELFKISAGIEAQVVPFNGTPPVISALIGGQVDAGIDILGPLMGQITSQALRPLAVLGARRAAQLPSVPTARESGGPLAGFDVSSWNGLAVPAKTPPAVIEGLNHEVRQALAHPDVKTRLLELNLVARGSTPAGLRDHLAADIKRWNEVIERAQIPRQ